MSLYKDASLVMIPSAYKDGKLYSIRPTDGDGDFTFSRGSNLAATRVDVNGLIEKGRENLLVQSNGFSTGSWLKVNANRTSGQSGYDGSSDAWLLSAISDFANLYQTITESGLVTFSVYAKAGTSDWMMMRLNGSSNNLIYVDLANQVFGGTSAQYVDGTITDLGSGWRRVSITINQTSYTHAHIYVAAGDLDLNTTNETIYIQDAQLEQGLVATDYIETGTSAAQSGILEDMPRLDYSGGASCPSLLLEPQRSNVVTQSEYFGSWNVARSTISDNAATSPEGVSNAAVLTEDTTNNSHPVFNSYTTSNGVSYTFSLFAKQGSRRYLQLFASNGGSSVYYDLQNQTAGAGGDIEDYGNGWSRLIYTYTTNSTSATFYIQPSIDGVTQFYTGDGSNATFLYGAQLEVGSYPTSYIPTYGTSQTRSVDDTTTLDLSNADLDGEDVTYFLEFKNNQDIARDSGATSLRFSSNTSNLGSFRIYRSSSSAKQLTVVFQDNGSAFDPNGYEMTSDNPKVAVKRIWATGQIQVFVDGTEVVDGVNKDMNAWYKIDMEGSGSTLEIKQLVAFPTALTDSECIALTS